MSQYLRGFLKKSLTKNRVSGFGETTIRLPYERLYRIKYIHQELHQQKQKNKNIRNFMGHSTPKDTFVI